MKNHSGIDKKIIIFIAAIVLLISASALSVSAYYIIRLKKQYENVAIGDVYYFGQGESRGYCITGQPAGSTVTVNAGYDFDVVITGGSITGAEPVLTAGSTGVYEFDAATTEISIADGPTAVNIAVIKHSEANVYINGEEGLLEFGTFNAVLRNGTFYNDGTVDYTDGAGGDYVLNRLSVSRNLRHIYLISDIQLTGQRDIYIPADINRLWFNLSGNGFNIGIHNPYNGQGYIDGVEGSGAFADVAFVNYSGCDYSFSPGEVTLTNADSSEILDDALAYAAAIIPECAFRAFVLPDKYLDCTLAYSYSYADGSGIFTGINSFDNNTRVTLMVSASDSEQTFTASRSTVFYKVPEDFTAQLLSVYVSDLKLIIASLIENKISLTVNFDSRGPVTYAGGYSITIDAASKTVNGSLFNSSAAYETALSCTVCRGSELYYRFGNSEERRLMRYNDNNAPTLEESLSKCVYDMYFNADTSAEILYNNVLSTAVNANGGTYFRIASDIDIIDRVLYSTEFYTTAPITAVGYTAYIDIMAAYRELEGENWYSSLTNTSKFRPLTFFTYDNEEGRFCLPAATSTTDTNYVYMLEVTYTGTDGAPAFYRYWDNIVFPDGGLTGGASQYSNISFNVPSYMIESESGDNGYIFTLNNEFCKIAPYISAVNGKAPEADFSACEISPVSAGTVLVITVRDGDSVSQVTAGHQYKITINPTELAGSADTSITVRVPIYVRNDDGIEYRFLSEKEYTFTIPAVSTPCDFAGESEGPDNYSEDGLWIYLKVLEKLYISSPGVHNPFDDSNGKTVSGYIINSALTDITSLDCTAAALPSEAMRAAIAYCNLSFGKNLTYDDIVANGAVDGKYLASVSGLSLLSSLSELIADGLDLGSCADVGTIGGCRQLTSVSLRKCGLEFSQAVKDIDFSALGKLTEIHIEGNNISDVTDILPITVETLSMGDSTSASAVSLIGLEPLFALRSLDISKPETNTNPGVIDLLPLMKLENIEELNLTGNQPEPGCTYRVIVHLYNHISGINIYLNDSDERFSVAANTDGQNTDNYGMIIETSSMRYDYYELYTCLNGIVLMEKYETEADFESEIDAITGIAVTYSVQAGGEYVELTATENTVSVSGVFRINISQ